MSKEEMLMKKDYRHVMPYRDDWKQLTGKLPVSMTNDYLFRALLQADEKTLIAMIASLLHLRIFMSLILQD